MHSARPRLSKRPLRPHGRYEERCFKLRWRQPDALVQHRPMKTAKCRRVGLGCTVVVRHRAWGKEPGPHGSYAIQGQRNACLRSLGGDTLRNSLRSSFNLGVDLVCVLLKIAHGRNTRRHGQRVSAQRSSLIDRAQRRQVVHQLPLAAKYTYGKPPPTILPSVTRSASIP